MRIVLATPLFPPEVAGTALYSKELARRLSVAHEVTVVAYAHLPEQVPGVRIVDVNKHLPLLFRLISYTLALAKAMRDADVAYIINGTSVELPAVLIRSFSRTPFIFCIADAAAHTFTSQNSMRRIIENNVSRRALQTVTVLPNARPEILPLEPYPTDAFAAYEASWAEHIARLNTIFSHVE